jgi:uncharacterized membrane protein
MSIKQVILSVLPVMLMCLIVAGAFQAPALAAGSSVLYSGTVENGSLVSGSQANGCYVTFFINSAGTVHATIVSTNYQMANTYLPVGQSVYYYDQLVILVGQVSQKGDGTWQASVELSAPSTTTTTTSTGTSLSSETPGQTALAGDSVSFPITITNNNDGDRTYTLSASGASGWGLSFELGTKSIYQVTVPESQSKIVNFVVQTPYTASIGQQTFTVSTGDASTSVNVDITSVNSSVSVTPKVSTVISYVGSKAYYDISLENLQAQDNDYKLSLTGLPNDNWYYAFLSSRTSTDEMAETIVPASTTQSLVLEIVPPYTATAGTYNFTATVTTSDGLAISKNLTLQLKSGTGMSVSYDQLAYSSNAGDTIKIPIYVTNTGTATLTNVYASVSAPSSWVVTSSPNSTATLQAGKTQIFYLSVQSPGNIVASDYSVVVTAKSDQEAAADDTFRITITTQSYIPYIGGGLIIVVLAGLFFMYRKYGRR